MTKPSEQSVEQMRDESPFFCRMMEFARHCLGWKDAVFLDAAGYIILKSPTSVCSLGYLNYNSVLPAVSWWCDQHKLDYSLAKTSGVEEWTVTIFTEPTTICTGPVFPGMMKWTPLFGQKSSLP